MVCCLRPGTPQKVLRILLVSCEGLYENVYVRDRSIILYIKFYIILKKNLHLSLLVPFNPSRYITCNIVLLFLLSVVQLLIFDCFLLCCFDLFVVLYPQQCVRGLIHGYKCIVIECHSHVVRIFAVGVIPLF